MSLDPAEQQIRKLERDALGVLTSSLSFGHLGNYLCQRIESITDGVLVSVCRVVERRLKPWAAPSFPASYGEFFEGVEIGEGMASCGTAAHRGAPVMVYDIATDPLWTPFKHVMIPHGFRACWTYPVKRSDGSIAGTFAFYFKRDSEPDPHLERIAEASVHLCVLAIEREENRQKLNRLMRFDTLTGLPNRDWLHRHVYDHQMASAGRGITVFYVGLDQFEEITNPLGHAAGDQVLVTAANRLRDLFWPKYFISRPEEDRFVVVALDCDTREAAMVAERIRTAIAAPVELAGQMLELSASVGISHDQGGTGGRDDLLANAQLALYRVKQAGGDGYEFFNPAMNELARDRLLLGAALKRAIANGGLRLHYQPQVRTDTRTLCGLEALARWHDPERGNIPPSRFIGLAEETGLIEPIGRWALREACRQLAQWRAEGLVVPMVSVNLSPINFRSSSLPEYIAALLCEFALSGDSLTIEITESTMMALSANMMEIVCRIRALGVGLSVDDFGTGFSSLSNLINLPVTEVKIDHSFIDKCLEESRLRALVAAVVGMGRSLGLTVVAEGVETQEQHQLLNEYGCPVLQGSLFSRPLNPEMATFWLRNSEESCATASTQLA